MDVIADPKRLLSLEKSLQRALDFSRPHLMLRVSSGIFRSVETSRVS
jgi:hypothetical protein